jgi:hypothetical protein
MIGPRFNKRQVLTLDERADAASAALVVIDVQSDFVLLQGASGQVGDGAFVVKDCLIALSAERELHAASPTNIDRYFDAVISAVRIATFRPAPLVRAASYGR